MVNFEVRAFILSFTSPSHVGGRCIAQSYVLADAEFPVIFRLSAITKTLPYVLTALFFIIAETSLSERFSTPTTAAPEFPLPLPPSCVIPVVALISKFTLLFAKLVAKTCNPPYVALIIEFSTSASVCVLTLLFSKMPSQ